MRPMRDFVLSTLEGTGGYEAAERSALICHLKISLCLLCRTGLVGKSRVERRDPVRKMLQSSPGGGTETWAKMAVVIIGSQNFLLCAYMDDKCPMPRGTLINLSSIAHNSYQHGYFPN